MNKKLFILLGILICLISQKATAQKPFSEYLPNARSIGLGLSAVALPLDPSAVYWNPASLAFLTDDQMLININSISRFNLTGFTKFFPPKIRVGVNIFRSMSAQSKYELTTLALGFRINSAFSLGSNINMGRMENGEFISSFGFGLFMKSFPDYRNQMNTTNTFWRWFRSEKMKDKLSFGLTLHNIPIQNLKTGQQLRAAVALKPSTYSPLFHLAYHLSLKDYSFHLGTQVNLLNNFDLFLGMKDFDLNQAAVGVLARFSPFSLEMSYLPETQQYHFSFYFIFSENRIELSQKYKKKGADFVKKNDYLRALSEYEKALSYNQDDKKLNLLYSVLLDKVNERKNKIDLLYAKALDFEKKGVFGNAYLVYRNILEIDPYNQSCRKRLNNISPKLNEYLEELYQQAIKYYASKDFDQAKLVFDKILKIDKTHKGADSYSTKIDSLNYTIFNQFYLRGIGYYEQKNYMRANEEFIFALKINPDHEKALEYQDLISFEIEKKQKRIQRLLAEAKMYEGRNLFVRANNRYKQILRIDRNNRYAAGKVEYLRGRISSVVDRKFREANRMLKEKQYLATISGFEEILSINSSHKSSKRNLLEAQQGLKNLIDNHFKQAHAFFEQK